MIKNEYNTERLTLRLSNKGLGNQVLDYLKRNKDFLSLTDSLRSEEYFTREYQRKALERDEKNIISNKSIKFWVSKNNDKEIIGMVTFNEIIMGPFLSCFLSYQLDKNELNKGYMTEAVKKAIEVVFRELKLHRIEANIMPRNKASIKVVEKIGFEYEGLARKYLKINGVWEDHIHMVLLNDEIE